MTIRNERLAITTHQFTLDFSIQILKIDCLDSLNHH